MKLEICDDSKMVVSMTRIKLELRSNAITLLVVDEWGAKTDGGAILQLGGKGVCLYPKISERIGFPLDSRGCVKLIEYD